MNNSGNIYIADSTANHTSGNRHTLKPGEVLEISLDDSAADEDIVFLDLSEIWFDGAVTGDRLVVSFLTEEYTEY